MENCSMNQIDITGCRISLYPMKDDFASHILRSIKETDTTAVWQQTDLFSTLYRGEAASVIDAAAALLSMPMTQKHIWSVSSLFRKAVQEIWLVMPFSAASMNGQTISKLLQKVRSSFSANILFMSLDVKIIWKKLRISSRWRMPWAYNRNRPIT